MFKFFIRLIVFAAFLGALAWFVPPVLKSRAPSLYDKIATAVLGREVRSVPESVEENMPEGLTDDEYEEEMARRIAEREARNREKLEKRIAAKRAAVAARESVVPVQRVVVVQETEEDLGPDPRAASNEEPPFPWGLVVTNSMCYDADTLAEVSMVDGGTVIARMDDHPARTGLYVETKVLQNGEWKPRTVLFHEADIVSFGDVRYSQTNRAQRDMLIDFCTAYGKAEALRAKLIERLLDSVRYPQEAAWQKAKADFDAFQAKTEALKKDINSSNPSVRGRALDQGRVLKHDEARIKRAWEAADAAKGEWMEANAPDVSSVLSSPMLAPHLEVLRRLSPQAEAVIPGLTPPWLRQ